VGHKVHPTGFRLGVIRDWQAKWYSDRNYADFLQEDIKIRQAIRAKYPEAAISLVEIDRQAKDILLTLYTARPGIVIGRGGQRVDEIRVYLENLIQRKTRLNIQEIRQPELDAYLVARTIAEQIERRVAYRRAMKQAIFRTIQSGAKGIKISCAGRLGNAEIARRQTMHQGQVPLHTLRADIDYGFTEARTTLGRIGVKVWIYKGQILPEPKVPEITEAVAATAAPPAKEETTAPAAEPVPATTAEKPVAEEMREAVAEKTEAEIEEKPPAEVATAAAAEITEAETAEKPKTKAAKKAPAAATEIAEAETAEKPETKAAKPATRKATAAAAEITEAETAEKPETKAAKPAARSRKKPAVTAETGPGTTQAETSEASQSDTATLKEEEETDAAT